MRDLEFNLARHSRNKNLRKSYHFKEIDPISHILNMIESELNAYRKYCSILDTDYQKESYEKMVNLKNIEEITQKILDFDENSIDQTGERISKQMTYFKQRFQIPREEEFQILKDNFTQEKNKVKNGDEITGSFLLTFIQFLRLDELTTLLETSNQKKEMRYRSFEKLKSILELFYSSTRKKVLFEDEKIVFELKNGDKISPNELSSGEKQILIFFTHLLFAKNRDIESIILYDEPDLSLHLDWQENFIDTVLQINSKIQMILATHSPGIGGKMFQTKSIKLDGSLQ